jgi:hypothetical protein
MCAIHPLLSPKHRAEIEQRIAEIENALIAIRDSKTPRSQRAIEWEALLSELADLKEQLND